MTSTGSISLSGLLGGTAGQIDTTSLITQLMQAQSIPQTQLKDQLSTVQAQLSAYQAINTKLSAVQAAASTLVDPTTWTATTATSSTEVVAASSSGSAAEGSTTFDVTQLARAQVTTVAADASGTVVSNPSGGMQVTDATGTVHTVALTGGSAGDVAAAINAAAVGVRASVVRTSTGVVLQMTSVKTGEANAFSIGGTDSAARNIVSAQDAKVSVGDPSAGGYSVSSSSNTFTDLIPGVTFSVNAVASDVTITVDRDEQSISGKLQALVAAVNAAASEASSDTARGAVLQGRSDARSVSSALTSAVSNGTNAGTSLKQYGIDLDSTGALSFDSTAFAAAYAADPDGTQSAVAGSFASAVNTAATAAADPTAGTITAAITTATSRSTGLNDEIDTWTTRLADIKSNLEVKYSAMETALARLQSQQTYLTSMFDSIDKTSSSSSS